VWRGGGSDGDGGDGGDGGDDGGDGGDGGDRVCAGDDREEEEEKGDLEFNRFLCAIISCNSSSVTMME
jgi:hypothetical protein